MKLYFRPILLSGGMDDGGDYPATGDSNEGGDEGGTNVSTREVSVFQAENEFTGMSPMTEIELPIAEESVKSEAAAIAPAEQAPAIEITPIELG